MKSRQKRATEPMEPVFVRLPPKVIAKLQKRAKNESLTMSAVIRRSVTKDVQGDE